MKDWLKRNRIYFDVAAPVLVGIAATIVAGLQYKVAQAQLNVQRAVNSPVLYVEQELNFNEVSGKFDTPTYVIKNDGEAAIDHSADLSAFFRITWPAGDQEDVYVPVVGFHPWTTRSAGVKGELARFVGVEDENRLFSSIYRESLAYPKEVSGYFELSLNALIRVEYQDRLGEMHVSYFLGTNRLANSNGEVLWSLLRQQSPLDYSDITFEKLLKRAEIRSAM